jgi:hypothetical protein
MKITTCIQEAIKCSKAGLPVLLMGSPGLGKTSVPMMIAKMLGLPYRELRCAEFESVDFRGICVADLEKRVATWLPADFWPTEACVLNFDEITQAPAELTSPLLKIFLGGSIGEYKLPAGTILFATGNLVSDRAGCSRITSALRERCVVINIEADAQEWLEWYDNEPDRCDAVLSFIQANPAMLHRWDSKLDFNQPTPRNWARLGKLMAFDPAVETIAGIVGPEVAPVFHAHYHTSKALGATEDYLDGKPLPKSPAAMSTAVQAMARDLVNKTWDADAIASFVEVVDSLPGSMQILFIKTVVKTGGVKAISGKDWRKLVARHAATINEAVR